MALPDVVKNTCAHVDTDIDPAPICGCRPHFPTLQLDSPLSAPLVLNEEQSEARRQRPGKKRRARFNRLVERLVEKKLAEPTWAPLAAELPPSIAASVEKSQKVSTLVAILASRK